MHYVFWKPLKKFALWDSSLLTLIEDNCKTFSVALKFYWRKYDIIICAKKQYLSIIMPPLTAILQTWHWQYWLSRPECKPWKDFFLFFDIQLTDSWQSEVTLNTSSASADEPCWQLCLNNRLDSRWQVVWVLWNIRSWCWWEFDLGLLPLWIPFSMWTALWIQSLIFKVFLYGFLAVLLSTKAEVRHAVISRSVGPVAPSLCAQPSELFRVCVRWAV